MVYVYWGLLSKNKNINSEGTNACSTKSCKATKLASSELLMALKGLIDTLCLVNKFCADRLVTLTMTK